MNKNLSADHKALKNSAMAVKKLNMSGYFLIRYKFPSVRIRRSEPITA